MDDRQYAFLARQPSAALENRERFLGMPKRGLAFLLANVMFWQPMWAQAEGIVVSAPGTGLDRAGNGVPIVNIAKPNANGLSHNQFKDYNVGSNGVILNNATSRTQSTQLGGIIVGNPNLQGAAATTILNEVNGGSPSQLRGYTEVAGQSAHVIVANPYGISCNGCGFINSPKVTLSTGKPVVENGRLDRYQVDQGSVAIEGAGLNASNVDHFEIITRSAKINAEIQARNLTIVAGRNDVNADTLNATARADDGSVKPELAIDSSALGGMYAGAIKLVGTEAGVGVKLDGKLIASGGDIQLDANGHLSMVDTSASGAVNVKAASLDAKGPVYAGTTLNAQTQGDLSNRQTLAARDSITLNAGGQLSNNGIIEAGVNADTTRNASGDVSVTAQNLNNNGKSIVASRNLTANVAQTLNNQGGTLSAVQTATVKAGTLDNQNKGRLLSSGALGVTADKLLNTQGIVSSNGNLTANVGQLINNAGELSSLGNITLRVASLDNVAGLAAAGQMLDISASGQINNQSGRLTASKNAQLSAASLDNRQGSLSTQQGLNLNLAGQLLNAQGSVISSDTLQLKAGQVNNAAGRIASAKALDASVTGLDQQGGQLFSNTSVALDLNHGQLNNQGGLINAPGSLLLKNLAAVNNRDGEISSDQAFSLNATSLDNSGGNLSSNADLTVNIDGTLTNVDGEISSAGLTRLNALALNNSNGQVLGDNALDIDLSGALDNRNGVLGSGKAVTIKAASLNNSAGGQLISDGSLTARISGVLDNQNKGEVVAKGGIDLQTGHLDNRGGRLAGSDLLSVHSDSVDNRGGNLRADKALQLTVDQLDNRDAGVISGKSSVTFDGARLDNRAGLLTSVGPLTLKAHEVQNGLGRISSQGQLTANLGALQQQGGALVAQGNLSLSADTLDNRNGGLVGTTKALDLQVGQIDNRAGELSAGLGATIGGQRLDNSNGGKLIVGTDLEMKVAELINQSKGLIHAQGHMTLSGSSLDNSEGLLNSLNGLVITLDNALLNSKGLISSEGELTVEAGSLDNTAGSLSSAAMLSIASGAGLINQGGSISTDAALTVKSASLDNSQKGLISGKAATQVTTGALDNSQGGLLTSGNTLTLNATQVNNAAGRIASAKALEASVTGLDQQGGELFSNTSLSLDLNQGQLNNQGGLINASGALLLSNLKDVNNQDGEISSKQAFTLAAENFDNSGGKLLSNQGLMLRIAQVLSNARGAISAASLDSRSNRLDNSDGLISSRDGLDLTVGTLLDNQRGSLIADGALLLVADRLDNRAGSIAGKTGLDATVSAVDNRQGTLISTDALTLKASSLDNRQAGLVGATKALDLDVDELDNRGGELSSNADVTLVSQSLDNSDGGQVFAGQALKLTVDKLLNRTKGLLSAKTELELNGGSLDNSGGYLISQQNQRINLSRDLLNNQGQLSSEGTLNVTAANLTNTGGSLSSAADLTVHSLGRVDNQGGELLTDGALLLTSAALDNRQQGNLSGKGAVNVTTGAFDNSQKGRLNSGGTLNLVAGQVTNQDGASIGSQGALTASVTGLDQQGGQLFSNTSLSLDLHNGQLNNQGGLINAPGALLLKNLNGVNNQGGEISSAQAFTLTAQNLTNDSGKLLSSQSLTLRIAQALSNVKGLIGAASVDAKAQNLNNNGGTITSRGGLELTVDQQLNNQAQGLISAAQLLTLNSGDLNNQGGSVLASGALVLNAMALNNSANGLINAQGDLTLGADSLDSSDGGEVSAKGDINLTLASLTQDGGRLLGEKAVTLNLGNGDLNNRNGLITAKGPLTFNALRDLTNQGGEISSSQSFNLKGRTLDNSGGKLISSQNLGLDGQALVNQNGLISGWQGLLVNGASLDNRNNGTLSSRNGNVNLNLLGNLLNGNGGALVSQGSLGVTAGSVDNTKGILSSGGAQNLTLSGALDNGQGGLIDSGADLTIKATSVANVSGAISAQQALTVDTAGLNNRQGSLIGNAAVNLNLNGVLDNSGAKLASAGPLTVKGATAINNQGGQIASQDQLTLLTGALDNSNTGTVAAKNALAITATGAVLNHTNGLIYSQTADVELNAASLANGKGEMQGQTGLDLELSGNLDNQGGKLIAQTGDVSVSAASTDNRGGTLAALKGAIEARTVGVLRNGLDVNNKGGVIQGQRLNIRALAGLNNNGGRIAAQAGDVIINTTDLNNRNGGLYATGLVNVSGANLDNSAGQIAGNRIELGLSGVLTNSGGILESDSTMALRAASVDNQGGKLRALGTSGTTDFQIGSLFDNRNGSLETANTNLTLAANSFLNSGGQLLHLGDGTFDISLPNVTGAGGTLVTRGGLTLNADTWTNTTAIQAGRLNVNVNNFTQTETGQLLASTRLEGTGGNWVNNGLIASDGDLQLSLGGTYSGVGRVSSLGRLSLKAASVSLPDAGRITGGGSTDISAGSIINRGRMTANDDLLLNTSSLNNYGTLGSAQDLTVNATQLLNDRGLIFSGAGMQLRSDTLKNNYADIYSFGDLTISRNAAGARADVIENISGTLESAGDMRLLATSITNRKDELSYTQQRVNGYITHSCAHCSDEWNVWYYVNEVYETTLDKDSPTAFITSGGNLAVTGSNFLNQYSSVSAAKNINITVDTFKNEGVNLETITYRSNYRNPADREPGSIYLGLIGPGGAVNEYNKYSAKYVPLYRRADGGYFYQQESGLSTELNPDYDPSKNMPVPVEVTRYGVFSATQTASTGKSVNAVIQSGGSTTIIASTSLNNSVQTVNAPILTSDSKVDDTGTLRATTPFIVHLNSQLPPDLAQQRVDPLALPGFVMPQGQNGLFRLSGQGSSSAPASQAPVVPSTWTIGGASVSASDRTTGIPALTGRNLQIADVGQVSAADRQLQLLAREGADITVGASTIQTAIPTDPATGMPQLPGHTHEGTGTGGAGATDVSVAIPKPVASQTVARVAALPDATVTSNPHKYLIETNPALTELKQFMSSDYLLQSLGYDPDQSAKRLGDGLYEQRLVQQAVIARTGQRFLEGQTSNEGMFKYLMNNALASKQALDLSVGVSLTSEQVAALTHDIVWMENVEVNGEQVLTPVLYLANANNRLAANGALIQGQDVTLIAGKDLSNAGTLRASNNLSATAANDLTNSGLMEAGNRLDLLAGNDLTNKAGGIIAGRDVSLTTARGDVVNERTVTNYDDKNGAWSWSMGFADSAARIEAGNNLSIDAGRDFNTIGSVVRSGNDLTLEAGRDVNIVSAQKADRITDHGDHDDSAIKQLASEVTAGRDLDVTAGRNLTAIASELEAKRDVGMSAGGDMTLASAADEVHSYNKGSSVTRKEDHVSQVATTVKAGGDVVLGAGNDMTLIASRISAANEAYLVAQNKLQLLAAQNSDYTLYDMEKKGGWGSKKTQRDEVTDVKNIGSEISAGGDLTLVSGGDQRYQVAKLESGGDIALDSGGAITFEALKDLHDESHLKSDGDAFWTSSKGKGNTDETLRQTQMVAAGSITIKAVEGLKIDIKHVDQQTVSQAIDAMVQADPKLAWLKEAEARGDVDWRQVKEIHESFKYSNSGLGPASQLIIAIALAAVLGPMMAGMNMMVQAGALSVATKATVSTIDNRGNLGAVLKDVTSKDSLKGYAVSVATAGITQGLNYNPGTVGLNVESLKTVAMKAAADAVIKTAVYGGSFKDNLATSLAGTAASIAGAYGAGKIGDLPLTEGGLEKILLHSALGGLMAEVMGGDFRTGAIAGGANEVVVGLLGDTLLPSHLEPGTAEYIRAQEYLVALSKIVGVLGAAASNGDLAVAAQVAENGTRYNFLGNHSQAERDRALKEYDETKSLDAAKKMIVLQGADQRSDGLLERFHTDPGSLSTSEKTELAAYLQVYGYEQSLKYGEAAARTSIDNLLMNGPSPYRDYPFAGGTTQERIAYADALRAQDGVSIGNIFWSRDQSASEMLYRDAQGYLRINGEMQAMGDVGAPALYFLTGNLGTMIRISAAANGVLQAGHGVGQVDDGDTWNGIGNIVVGAMNAASLGIPKIGTSGNMNGGAGSRGASTKANSTLDNAASQADNNFGYLNQPGPATNPAFFDPQGSATKFIKNGRINATDLEKLMPPGIPDTFKASASITEGRKYQYVWNGQRVEVKWHAPDASAAAKFPESNSGAGWTAQIKIGNKLLGQDGVLYRKPSNLTHIPVDFK
ncbi:filamentous hemagglutinin N-terminal domain-containing protein [Pseudomonas sp. Z1-14]|uniref:two-partner secretion domain-containing protein n=1 Tax=Pseudomonas sp. Z1-14 TaxID=2817409 RepID=UPI003DA97B50